VTVECLRAQVGVMMQDPRMLPGTLRLCSTLAFPGSTVHALSAGLQ
jgi:hypothetical protein